MLELLTTGSYKVLKLKNIQIILFIPSFVQICRDN